MIIEDRPEGCIYSLSSNLTLNRQDIRSKFGYTIISKIRAAFGERSAREFHLSTDFEVFDVPKRCASQTPLPVVRCITRYVYICDQFLFF